MGKICSATLLFLLILNVLMQVLFIYLLATTSLTKAQFTQQLVAQYRSWRRNEAHSVVNYDELGQSSLTSHVCDGDVLSRSAEIADDFGTVDEYLGDGRWKGTYMCALALIAWYCTVSDEFQSTIDAYRSVPPVVAQRGLSTGSSVPQIGPSTGSSVTQIGPSTGSSVVQLGDRSAP